MNINELEMYGLPFFAHCALGRPLATVKLVTVVRHPVDRFVSALRYFDQVGALSGLRLGGGAAGSAGF